jgi:membrane-bound lytic murein transglycosylase A
MDRMMREPAMKIESRALRAAALALLLASSGCSTPPPEEPAPAPVAATPAKPPAPPSAPAAAPDAPHTAPRIPPPRDPAVPAIAPAAPAEPAAVARPATPRPVAPAPTSPPAPGVVLRAVPWPQLPGWREDDPSEAWSALLGSCRVLAAQASWRPVCAAAAELGRPTRESAQRFFERHFTPHRVAASDSGEQGLITGYYEPLLRGSRTPTARFRYPVYGVPDDLLVVDLSELHPELKGLRLRGRLEGRRVVPYYDRAQIEAGHAGVRGRELAWVDDPVELFFLHIQGSGRLVLENGETMRVGFADQNGHPYRSIGRVLIEQGELPLEQTSMQGIKAWARQHPHKLNDLLHTNARFIFFQELPPGAGGPPGALGVPLTPRRSVAVDPRFVPLGAPVYVATTWPNSPRPLNRLMLAQDTGAAIRGAVRADFFWGEGDAAAREAGRMKQPLRMWVLLPSGHPWALAAAAHWSASPGP